MRRKVSQSNPEGASTTILSLRTHHQRPAPYQRVRDERKRPIRGLWVRNGRYYAQLTVEAPWATPHSPFTLACECFALRVLQATRVQAQAASLLRLTPAQVHDYVLYQVGALGAFVRVAGL